MFGMGLGEVLLIAVMAGIFLGPDKLPSAMVETAKFFRTIKKHLTEAKTALDSELNLTELKSDVLQYKNKLSEETQKALEMPKLDESSREVRDLFADLSGDAKKIDGEIKGS